MHLLDQDMLGKALWEGDSIIILLSAHSMCTEESIQNKNYIDFVHFLPYNTGFCNQWALSDRRHFSVFRCVNVFGLVQLMTEFYWGISFFLHLSIFHWKWFCFWGLCKISCEQYCNISPLCQIRTQGGKKGCKEEWIERATKLREERKRCESCREVDIEPSCEESFLLNSYLRGLLAIFSSCELEICMV